MQSTNTTNNSDKDNRSQPSSNTVDELAQTVQNSAEIDLLTDNSIQSANANSSPGFRNASVNAQHSQQDHHNTDGTETNLIKFKEDNTEWNEFVGSPNQSSSAHIAHHQCDATDNGSNQKKDLDQDIISSKISKEDEAENIIHSLENLKFEPVEDADNSKSGLEVEDSEVIDKSFDDAQVSQQKFGSSSSNEKYQSDGHLDNITIGPQTPGPQDSASSDVMKDLPPLNFDSFLQKMKSPHSFILTRYLRSFLKEFKSRNWSPEQQVRIINEFIDFIIVKVGEVGRDIPVSEERKSEEANFVPNCWTGVYTDEAKSLELKEGMEKLVLTKLYSLTFCPDLSDDSFQDRKVLQKIELHNSWIEEKHLDIPLALRDVGLVRLAKQELLKINEYKSPRDKMICILNCCKIIIGFIEQHGSGASADDFLPVLIFVIIRANPPRLYSNVQYIQRFRNPDRLKSECGYYLTNTMGAISFIQNLECENLTIDQVEYDHQIAQVLANNEDLDLLDINNTENQTSKKDRSSPSRFGSNLSASDLFSKLKQRAGSSFQNFFKGNLE